MAKLRRAERKPYAAFRSLLRAAFCASRFSTAGPFDRTAFLAAARRDAPLLLRAAERACFDKLFFDAAERPIFFSAPRTALERRAEIFFFPADCPLLRSRFACLRVRADVVPFFGALSFTPARRAFESPIAIACLVFFAPCLPSRTCSISSRTNSPA